MKPIYLFTHYKVQALVALLVMVVACSEHAQAGPCGHVSIDTLSAWASKSKCGWTNYCNGSPPTLYFLTTTIVYSWSFWMKNVDYNYQTDQHCNRFGDAIVDYTSESGYWNEKDIYTMNRFTQSCTITYSGKAYYTHTDPYGVHTLTYVATQLPSGDWYPSYEAVEYAIEGLERELAISSAYMSMVPSRCTLTMKCGPEWVGKPSWFEDVKYCPGGVPAEMITYHDASVDADNTTYILDNEYTDLMLRGDAMSLMPAYPKKLDGSFRWANNANSSAYYHLTADHYTASAGKMKYRFHVTDCVKDEIYLVKWWQITVPDNVYTVTSYELLEEKVTGNGDPVNGVYTSEREVGPPAAPSTIYETGWTVTVAPKGGTN
jgi:hypothetical protein